MTLRRATLNEQESLIRKAAGIEASLSAVEIELEALQALSTQIANRVFGDC